METEKLILKEREFKVRLVELLQNSQLPAFILKSVLKETLEQVMILEQQEYSQAIDIMKLEAEEESDEKNRENNSRSKKQDL